MNIQLFNFEVNLLQVILWQYNKATNLQGLVGKKQLWYDLFQTLFWDDFYADIFNLVTATDFGLSVWSIILGLPLFIPTETNTGPIWGFNEVPSINTYENFENGNFISDSTSITLTSDEQRLILRLRYYQLVSRGAVPEVNLFLSVLFQTSGTVYSGHVWMLDNFDMTITYVFDFFIPRKMRYILQKFDLLPRPAAVGIKYLDLSQPIFGFNENPEINGYLNFENSNFIAESF